jgi:hypothetical protein
MNGRVYDPLIGRFMSADPFIQAPDMLQSYNRYAYVMNNPLNLTDPSGFSWWTRFRGTFVRAIAAVADVYGCGGYCSAAVGAYQGSQNGGGLRGAIVGGLNGYFGFQYGGDFSITGYAISAASGCASAAVSGGSCARGATSGLVGHFGSQYGIGGAAAAGCVSAQINGGSCGQGARDGATSYAISYVVRSAADAGRQAYLEAQSKDSYRGNLNACNGNDCGGYRQPGIPSLYALTGIFLYKFLDTLSMPLQKGLQWVLNVNQAESPKGADSEGRTRGLPPEGITPPAGEVKEGPASRPSERDKGGKSLWDSDGGEWRYSPEDKWHHPHWDYNPHNKPSSPWQNIPIDQLPPRK